MAERRAEPPDAAVSPAVAVMVVVATRAVAQPWLLAAVGVVGLAVAAEAGVATPPVAVGLARLASVAGAAAGPRPVEPALARAAGRGARSAQGRRVAGWAARAQSASHPRIPLRRSRVVAAPPRAFRSAR